VRPKNIPPGKVKKHSRQRTRAAAKRLNVVGAQVRKIRLGLKPAATQEDLAGRLAACGFDNLTRVLVNRIESGRRTVIDVEILALAKALRVPVQRLFEKVGKTHPVQLQMRQSLDEGLD
jgi:transcriptional regulator with XRE-family HTH domain